MTTSLSSSAKGLKLLPLALSQRPHEHPHGASTTRLLLAVTCPRNPPSLHPEASSERFSSTKNHRQEPVSQQLYPGGPAYPLSPIVGTGPPATRAGLTGRSQSEPAAQDQLRPPGGLGTHETTRGEKAMKAREPSGCTRSPRGGKQRAVRRWAGASPGGQLTRLRGRQGAETSRGDGWMASPTQWK